MRGDSLVLLNGKKANWYILTDLCSFDPSKKIAMRKLLLRLIDSFYFLFKKLMPIKTYRYMVCGGGNLVLDIVLYFLVFHYVLFQKELDLGWIIFKPHIAAFFIVFPITFFTGFLLNKYIAFNESNLKGKIQLFRYGIVVAGAILLNYVLLRLFVDVWGFYPTPSKIVVTVISVVYSYTLQNRFTFRVKENVAD